MMRPFICARQHKRRYNYRTKLNVLMLLGGIQVHTVSMHQAVLKIQVPECCLKTPQALFKFCSQPIRGESGGGWSLM